MAVPDRPRSGCTWVHSDRAESSRRPTHTHRPRRTPSSTTTRACSTQPTSSSSTRPAVLVNELEADRHIDFNGVIFLSQILNFDLSPERPTANPGIDLPYQTVLPTYAATAWYHHKLPAEHAN